MTKTAMAQVGLSIKQGNEFAELVTTELFEKLPGAAPALRTG